MPGPKHGPGAWLPDRDQRSLQLNMTLKTHAALAVMQYEGEREEHSDLPNWEHALEFGE